MKLSDLDPRFVGSGGDGITDALGNPAPKRIGVGVLFECPCGTCGTEIYIPFTNPLDGGEPVNDGHATWLREGENFETMTLSPSILRIGGCGWHGFVRNGEIVPA